jgi:hypothetical protein
MKNYKQKFIKELESEIAQTKLNIANLEAQIKIHIPVAIKENELKIINLKALLNDVLTSDTFNEPIFSYCNNEDGYEEDYD